jgi:hypothetical protein
MIKIENPILEKKLKLKAKENNTTIELYISKVMDYESFNIDFREESIEELPDNLVKEVMESRKSDRE